MHDDTDPAGSYVLQTGDAAIERLRILDALTWPTTESLWDRAGVGPGMTAIDAGCGPGLVTRRLAERTGAAVTGIDTDAAAIAHARIAAATDAAATDATPPVTFVHGSVQDHRPSEPVDMVYARFLLSHLEDPAGALAGLVTALQPGGLVVTEDVHFPGHFCAPPNDAFDRYVELYEAVARLRGGDPRVGVRLPSLLRDAGLEDMGFATHVPHFTGAAQLDGLRFAAITLAAIRDAVVDAGLARGREVDELVHELDRFAREDGTAMSMVRICQAWGRLPG